MGRLQDKYLTLNFNNKDKGFAEAISDFFDDNAGAVLDLYELEDFRKVTLNINAEIKTIQEKRPDIELPDYMVAL